MAHASDIQHKTSAPGRTRVLRVCGLLLVLAALVAAAPVAAEKGKPLAVNDVMALLNNSVPSSEIARVVGKTASVFV